MTTDEIIRNLRGMLHRDGITQEDTDTICAAIRALGGNP